MKITNFSIRHATAIFVLVAVIVIGGTRAYNSLPKEAAPEVQIPVVIVQTSYFGVSPSDIETLVTRQLEDELSSLRDVEKMTSTSADSASIITLEFDPSIDIDDALQNVREKVDTAENDLPDGAEAPRIIEINSSDFPVLIANVSGEADPVRLQEIAEDVQDDIESIQGVLRAELAGGVDREVEIAVDPTKLRHHKLSLNQIIGAIQAENTNLPGGSIDVGSQKFTVRVPGEVKRVSELKHIVVKSADDQPVFLKDVAEVRMGFEERETHSRLTTWTRGEDGKLEPISKPNVSLSVLKRSGENILEIARKTKDVLADYREKFDQAGVDIEVINDSSNMIKTQVTDLENKIISGLLLVLITLFFFMGGARNALFVAISIPLSMLMSFGILQLLGVTLNMVVLFSLILALGMLVDNAIVVVENIYRHANEGKTRVQAAIDGTREVGWAITASTATTVGAFFPLLFWPGIMGEFMGYLPLTVIIVLASSLFVALVINPTICSKFIAAEEDVEYDEAEVPDTVFYRNFRRALEWSLDHRLLILGLSFATLVGSIVLFGSNNQGVELFPSTTPDKFNVSLEMPDGTRLEATDEVVDELEESLDTRPELVEAWVANIGTKGGQGMAGGGTAPHYGSISVDLVDVEDQPSDPDTFIKHLRNAYDDIPGATVSVEKADMGPPTGAPIGIEVTGDKLKVLQNLAGKVKKELRQIPGIIDIEDDLELTRPEIQVDVDRKQAALAGLDTRSIARTVRTAINGTEASVFREQEDEYDIRVQLQKQYRNDIEDLASLTVTNDDGKHIPLTELADIEVRAGSGSIHHRDEQRVVTITAKPADGYLAANLLKTAQSRLSKLEPPTGYAIRYTGENEDRQEASQFLSNALLIGLFLIAMVLVTEFNSIAQPVIILLSVLLSLIGVFWTLLITGEPFGIIMTGIGVISLAGVVVNNSIVMVDYINILRERGYDRKEAVVRGGLVRFRPVMLTAFTTALGLIPIVLGVSIDFVNFDIVFGGTSVEMWGPMARVVTAGLLVATVLTLIVVPVMYSTFDDLAALPGKLVDKIGKLGVLLAVAGLTLVAGPLAPAHAQSSPSSSETDALETSGSPLRVEPVKVDLGASRTLTLEKARSLVRQRNFDVRLAATRVDEAATTIRRAYSVLLPSISAGGKYIINDEEITSSLGPSSDQLPPGFDMGSSEFLIQPKTEYNWNVAASLRLSPRAIPLIKQAHTQKALSKKNLQVLKEQLDFATVQAYYNLLRVRQVIEISAEQLRSRRRERKATRRRLEAGVGNKFELTRSKLRVVQAKKQLERSQLQFEKVRESLAQMLQIEADFDVQRPTPPSVDRSTDALVETALEKRQILEARELNIELAQQSIDEVFTEYFPTIGSTFSVIGSKTTDLNPEAVKWQLAFSANWTLWNGGARKARIDRRRAQKIAAKLEKRQEKSEIETNIQQAWADYESARSQVETGETEVRLAEQTLDQTQSAYRRGVATQLDLIQAEDQVRSAKLTLIRDQLSLHLAARKLRHLAGLD